MNFRQLIEKMDSQNWVRLAVCIVPAMALVKLSAVPDAPAFLKPVGGIALAIGVVTYASWGYVRRKMAADIEDTELDATPEVTSALASQYDALPASEHLLILKDLYDLCGQDFEEVRYLLETESALHPDEPLAAVIEEAYRRLTFKRQRKNVRNESH